MSSLNKKETIRQAALQLGFDRCGFAKIHKVNSTSVKRFDDWIKQGKHSTMSYLVRNRDIREDPTLLLPTAKSIIVTALNYYPKQVQPHNHPQFSCYAYGEDYHKIIKHKLKILAAQLKVQYGGYYRLCVDSAPIRERYWAVEAGIGFIGRNNMLIIPGKGSYYFIGILLTSLEIEPDDRCELSCNGCGACIKACPSKALDAEDGLDARKCLSCLTIEYKGDLPGDTNLGNRIYGCDTCQQVCPHNRDASPNETPELQPIPGLFTLTKSKIEDMDEAEFNGIFAKSSIKRVGLEILKRNLKKL